jgi:hypothetical protein
MKNWSLILICSIFVLNACRQDGAGGAQQQQQSANRAAELVNLLGGDWIPLDFCARASQYGSVLGAMNNAHLPYVYALSFDPEETDSVRCFNGVESWKCAISIVEDTIEIKNAVQDKSVFLVYHSQEGRDMTMFDATKGQAQMDKFIKSQAKAKDGYAAFQVALNHHLLNGVFTLKGAGATGPVQFTPGGFILNLRDYDRYELCTGGDCFVAGDQIDVITFSNSKKEGSEVMLGYRYDGTNDNLTIYRLVNTNPDEKFAYKVGSVLYEFSRKKAE